MKVFQSSNDKTGYKINFVDMLNRFVGFDFSSKCCEEFGYAITKTCPKTFQEMKEMEQIPDDSISEYVFDISFEHSPKDDSNDEFGDSANCATFKAVDEKLNEIYITIWNSHNGYYSHGFEFRDGKKLIREDFL